MTTDNESKAAGLGRAQHTGDRQQSSLYSHRMSEAVDQPERGQDDGTLGLQGRTYENRGSREPKYRGLDDGHLGLEDQEEETPPEEVTGEESVDAQNPEEALAELERVLEKDAEEGVPEMRWAGEAGAQAGVGGGGPGRGCTGLGAHSRGEVVSPSLL